MQIVIEKTTSQHTRYAEEICLSIEYAAKVRGTGIGKRDPLVLEEKIKNGDAIIALDGNCLVGFCYVQLWSEGQMVSHSGLIIVPEYRKLGLAPKIKRRAMDLVQEKYPMAKIFGITTNLHVMKINTSLGYEATTFSEITKDDSFWEQCKGCPNYDILERTSRKLCLCTAMLAPAFCEMIT